MKELAQILRQRRTQLGMTLTAAAQAAGVTKGYLSMIENAKVAHPPARPVLLALEGALHCTGGEIQRAADWQNTPRPVRDELRRLTQLAQQGQELAALLRPGLAVRRMEKDGAERIVLSGAAARRVRTLAAEIEANSTRTV
jgi:transcriptional regulator with XRE-family HTH domain